MELLKLLLVMGFAIAVWVVIARKLRSKGKPALFRHLVGFTGFVFTTSVMLEALVPKEPDGKAAAVAASPQVDAAPGPRPVVAAEPATPSAPTLGLTPKAYAERVNAEFTKLNMNLRFPDRPAVMKGDVRDAFNVQLAPYLHVLGAIDKQSGELMDVTLMGAGGRGPEAAAELLVTAMVISKAAVTDPALNKKVGTQITALLGDKRADEESVSKVLGRVKLYHMRDPVAGIWFGASAM